MTGKEPHTEALEALARHAQAMEDIVRKLVDRLKEQKK